MKIEVLGTGCAKCKRLEENVNPRLALEVLMLSMPSTRAQAGQSDADGSASPRV